MRDEHPTVVGRSATIDCEVRGEIVVSGMNISGVFSGIEEHPTGSSCFNLRRGDYLVGRDVVKHHASCVG